MIANTNCLPLLCVCLSPQLCIALNDIEQVRHGVHELPEFVALDNLKADLRDKGEPLADEVEGNINVIMTEMDEKIFAILGDICSQIVEKVRIIAEYGVVAMQRMYTIDVHTYCTDWSVQNVQITMLVSDVTECCVLSR